MVVGRSFQLHQVVIVVSRLLHFLQSLIASLLLIVFSVLESTDSEFGCLEVTLRVTQLPPELDDFLGLVVDIGGCCSRVAPDFLLVSSRRCPRSSCRLSLGGYGLLGGARGKGKLRGLGGDGRFLLLGWVRVVWVWLVLQCQAFDVFFLLSKWQNLSPLDDIIDARLGEEFPPGIRHFDLRG